MTGPRGFAGNARRGGRERAPPPGRPFAVRVERTHVMHGPNCLAASSVALAILSDTTQIPPWAEVQRLVARTRPTAAPDWPRPGSCARAVEQIAREICAWCDLPPGDLERTSLGQRMTQVAALPLQCEAVAVGALRLAVDFLCQAAKDPEEAGWPEAAVGRVNELRSEAWNWLPGGRRWIARAAGARGIPCRLVSGTTSVLLLGEGRFGRRFDSTLTENTGRMAFELAANKRAANRRLRSGGVPMARQVVVQDLAGAREAISLVGLPMVMKPNDKSGQKGISFVYRPDEVESAYAYTAAESVPFIAESFIPGREYRVLACGAEIVAAFERPCPQVVGDGISTIAELAEQANLSGARGPGREGFRLRHLVLDDRSHALLRHQGMAASSVPAAGQVVQTHPLPFVGVGGGDRVDVTGIIHPDNRALAARALAVLGLDVGGIDFRTPDISRSWREVGAGFCEVNPQPDLSAHYLPGLHGPGLHGPGPHGDPAGRFVDLTYPPAGRGRMFHALLLGDGDLSAHALSVRRELQAAGLRTGLAIPGLPIEFDGYSSSVAINGLSGAYGLMAEDRDLDAAVYVASTGHVAEHGIGMPRADIAFIRQNGDRATNLARHALEAASARIVSLTDDLPATRQAIQAVLEQRSRATG